MDKIKENIPFILLIIVMILFVLSFIVSETNIIKEEEIPSYTFKEAVSMQVSNNTDDLKLTNTATESASDKDIEAAMNINNSNDFQFLRLDEPSGASVEELNQELKGKGILEGQGQAFYEAENKIGVNALYLISHASLETGHGQSELASGIQVDSQSYYNFFGIGAFDHAAVSEGTSYAQQAGWTSPESAILGGAEFLHNNYIGKGQNTLYRMRWNPENPGVHLYATDIAWPEKIARLIETHYQSLSLEHGTLDKDYYK